MTNDKLILQKQQHRALYSIIWLKLQYHNFIIILFNFIIIYYIKWIWRRNKNIWRDVLARDLFIINTTFNITWSTKASFVARKWDKKASYNSFVHWAQTKTLLVIEIKFRVNLKVKFRSVRSTHKFSVIFSVIFPCITHANNWKKLYRSFSNLFALKRI